MQGVLDCLRHATVVRSTRPAQLSPLEKVVPCGGIPVLCTRTNGVEKGPDLFSGEVCEPPSFRIAVQIPYAVVGSTINRKKLGMKRFGNRPACD